MFLFARRFLLPLLLLITGVMSSAQDSASDCRLKISLLTCSPGEELYSIFGHSAFRVTDQVSGADIIFNYGTFDFEDPDFYVKFVRGKLLYFVSASSYEDFIYGYRLENRSIIGQELNLDCEQKEKLFQALKENLREENKFYLYDFLFDNCSTRLRDMLKQNTGDVDFRQIIPENRISFRNMIHEYLENGHQYWSKFGIDLLLGSKIDRPAKNEESMFLPDYLMKGFDSATVSSIPLVASKQVLLPSTPTNIKEPWFKPFILSLLLLVVFGGMQFLNWKGRFQVLNIFDTAFFLVVGLLGLLMLFMWFGTDHALCGNNYNLVWALPTHAGIIWFLNSPKKWVRIYFKISALWYFLLFFAWALLPQDMNTAVVPLVVLLFIRSYVRSRITGR